MKSVVASNVKALRARLGLNQQAFADQLEVQQSYISKWEGGKVEPQGDSIAAMAEMAGCSFDEFKSRPLPPRADDSEVTNEGPDTVGIRMIDMAYGLGATYSDAGIQVDVVQFPRIWVEQITHSPPAHLTWTRGRGDSMSPTIEDGDLVLLDHSQRRVDEQDGMWAFAVGEVNAIKRLRVKGDRYQILSDNPNVPPDEEPQDYVNIVGRVVFVGRRK